MFFIFGLFYLFFLSGLQRKPLRQFQTIILPFIFLKLVKKIVAIRLFHYLKLLILVDFQIIINVLVLLWIFGFFFRKSVIFL